MELTGDKFPELSCAICAELIAVPERFHLLYVADTLGHVSDGEIQAESCFPRCFSYAIFEHSFLTHHPSNADVGREVLSGPECGSHFQKWYVWEK